MTTPNLAEVTARLVAVEAALAEALDLADNAISWRIRSVEAELTRLQSILTPPSKSTPVSRVTRYTFTVYDRGAWGREEVHVEEHGRAGEEPHWRVVHGTSLWDGATFEFCWAEMGAERWAAVKFTLGAALAEAPRAVAYLLKRYEKQLRQHDAETGVQAESSMPKERP